MRRRVELALVLVVLLVLGGRTAYKAGFLRDPSKRTRTDAFVFLEGADAIVSGTNPFGLRDSEHGLAYVYPPTPALVFVPLRPLGRVGAAIAWYLVSVAVFVCGVVALRRALGDEDWVPLVLVGLPLASSLERGQLSAVLAGCVTLGMAWLIKKKDEKAGAAIAFSVALKATPILALLAFARRPRGAASALATLVLLLLLLPAIFLGRRAIDANVDFADRMGLRYLRDPGSGALTEGTHDYATGENSKNQSLVAILERTRLAGTPAFRPLAILLMGSISIAAAVVLLRLPREVDPRALVAAVGTAASATLLAAPVGWHWHHVVLYPVFVALGRHWACAVFFALSVLHFAVEPLRPYGLLGLGTLVVLVAAAKLALTPRTTPT